MAENAVAVGGLLDKTYTEAKDILDRISRNHRKDNGYSRFGRRRSNNSRTPENDIVAALQTQLAAMMSLL